MEAPPTPIDLPAPFHAAGPHIALELGAAQVLFTTRRGGASRGPKATLDLGATYGEQPPDVLHNRRALADRLGVALAWGHQVHGHRVAVAAPGAGGEADGQATSQPRLAAMVMVADCVPVALAGEGAVAMLHAGWRGLASGVIGAGVERLRSLGVSGPVRAAVGPGAGPCCYEVGEEVQAAFAAHGASVRHGRHLDLKAVAARELERAGVEEIHDVGLCTICSDASLFFSYRRDGGGTGRQGGLAWLP